MPTVIQLRLWVRLAVCLVTHGFFAQAAMGQAGSVHELPLDSKLPTPISPFEYKAVEFRGTEHDCTKKLNELAYAGWEYIGPLPKEMVAFRRTTSLADAANLQGTWKTIASEWPGKVAGGAGSGSEGGDPDKGLGEIITYKGDKYALKNARGELTQEGTFKIVNATSHPKQIDYACTWSNQKEVEVGLQFHGVYSVEGNDHCFCLEVVTNRRPKELTGKAGFLRSTKREKDKPEDVRPPKE